MFLVTPFVAALSKNLNILCPQFLGQNRNQLNMPKERKKPLTAGTQGALGASSRFDMEHGYGIGRVTKCDSCARFDVC